MSPDSIALLQRPWPAPPLLANPIDPLTTAFQLEKELRGLVTEVCFGAWLLFTPMYKAKCFSACAPVFMPWHEFHFIFRFSEMYS